MNDIWIVLLFKMLIGHVAADFVLQPDAMAKGKIRIKRCNLEQQNGNGVLFWPYWLTAHALVHGGVVWVITGHPIYGFMEILFHWMIDFAKGEKWTTIHTDQILHMICKVSYVVTL